eukprot:COSAG05_NODE_1349_length_5113_cov_6.734144_4_plen_166_part_00
MLNSSIDGYLSLKYHGIQRLTAATRRIPEVLWHAVLCHSRVSAIYTDPAGATIVNSSGNAAATVMSSTGPRGLRVSRCEPGTTCVPPEPSATSTMYLHKPSVRGCERAYVFIYVLRNNSGVGESIHGWFVNFNLAPVSQRLGSIGSVMTQNDSPAERKGAVVTRP